MVLKAQELLSLGEKASKDEVEDYIIDLYLEMHHAFFTKKQTIPNEQIIDIRYEDFVQRPMHYIKAFYKHCGLDGFESKAHLFQKHIDSQLNYKRNIFVYDEALIRKINAEAGFVFQHYGYDMKMAGVLSKEV